MRTSLLLFFCILFYYSQAQSGFTNGFNDGYKKGYCLNNFSCVPPIPPVTPIPAVGESYDSYEDGYGRGFQMGLDASRSNGNTNSNNSGYQRKVVAPPRYIEPLDLNLYARGVQYKEQISKERFDRIQEIVGKIYSYANQLDNCGQPNLATGLRESIQELKKIPGTLGDNNTFASMWDFLVTVHNHGVDYLKYCE